MISFLEGRLVEATLGMVVLNVQGVGYEVLVPLSSFEKLPAPGATVSLLTHLSIREDAHVLYGFVSRGERDLFKLLIHTVSGIGPRIALNILSGISPTAFASAVIHNDVKALSQVSGVGKKTAERIVVELKDKLGSSAVTHPTSSGMPVPAADQATRDAIAALIQLDYKPLDAQQAVKAAQALLGPDAPVEAILRATFKKGAR